MTTSYPTLEQIAGDLATLQYWITGHLTEGTTPTREDLLGRLEDVEGPQADLEKVMSNLRAFLEAAGSVLRSPQVATLQPKAGA